MTPDTELHCPCPFSSMGQAAGKRAAFFLIAAVSLMATGVALADAPPPRLLITRANEPSTFLLDGSTYDCGTVDLTTATSYLFHFNNADFDHDYNGPERAPLLLTSSTLSGADAGSFTLEPFITDPADPILYNRSFTYRLTFTPVSTGVKSTTLTVLSNNPEHSAYTVTFHATGVLGSEIGVFAGLTQDSAAALTTQEGSQIFPETGIGSSSTKTFTVVNSGLGDLALGEITFAGTNAGDFAITQPPGSTILPPGGSTTFTVTFSPHAEGSRRAILLLASNDRDEPSFHIPLTGTVTVTGPQIQVTTDQNASPLVSGVAVSWGQNIKHVTEVPSGLGSLTAISAGNQFTLALKWDGTVVAWGDDSSGQLDIPAGLSGVTAISAGGSHSLALKDDGTVVAWGHSDEAQTDVPAGLTGVVAISAGQHTSLALKSDGTVVSWGNWNASTVPDGLTGITAIASSANQSLALRSNGTVAAWSSNPLTDSRYQPPAGLSDVAAIATNFDGCLALKSDGSVVTWAYDPFVIPPAFPTGPSDLVAIAAGTGNAVIGLHRDGTLLVPVPDRTTPSDPPSPLIPPAGLREVTDVTAGENHLAVLRTSIIDFGGLDLALADKYQFVTVRNIGAAPLLLGEVRITGPDAAFFTLEKDNLATTLEPGAVTGLVVHFSPTAEGERHATLHFPSNATASPDLAFPLKGAAFTVHDTFQTWKLKYFATTASTGPSADDADPNRNGIPNLLEFALGGDPLAIGSGNLAILPKATLDAAGNRQLILNNPPASGTGVGFTIQGSNTLEGGGWTDLARSANGGSYIALIAGIQVQQIRNGNLRQTGITDTTTGTAPRRFFRLRASRP